MNSIPKSCCGQLACDMREDSDEEDDEDQMLACIQSFAHLVQVGEKQSQKARKESSKVKRPSPLTKAQIQAIVHKISTGEITLPELPDLSDDDLITIWALWDAGSSARWRSFRTAVPAVLKSSTYSTKNDWHSECQ